MMTHRNNRSTYLMESDNENQRLAEKVNPETFIQLYLAPYITPESRILDIGCGPAVITEHLALQYSDIKITGLDISSSRLVEAAKNKSNTTNLSFTSADIYQMPFNKNSFDLIFSRFLFEYLQEPLLALSEIKRICKPGGWVVIQDIDGQFLSTFPEDQELLKNISNTTNVLQENFGFDPLVGRKLFFYLQKTPFVDIDIKLEPYHLLYGKMKQEEASYWNSKLSSVFPKISKYSTIDQAELQNQINHFMEYLDREDSLMFSNLFTVYGRNPNE